MQDDLCGLDEAGGAHGEQVRIAGACADQVDLALMGFCRWDGLVGQRMQQGFAGFAGGKRGEDFAALCSQLCKPGADGLRQLRVDLAAQALGEGGAFSAGGDGYLQWAALHDGSEEEITVGNVIYAVAEDSALDCGSIDCCVY